MPIGTSRSTPREHSSETKRKAALLRMLQAGVIASDYTTLMMEILKDNAQLKPARSTGLWTWLMGSRIARSEPCRKRRSGVKGGTYLSWRGDRS